MYKVELDFHLLEAYASTFGRIHEQMESQKKSDTFNHFISDV